MRPTEEQIKENKRLSKLTPFQRYSEITEPEFQKENPDKWVIFRALVDFEILSAGYYTYMGESRKIKPKTHFMNKCPRDRETLEGVEIKFPPKGISRKKANSICLLKAIQDFYLVFDPEKFRGISEDNGEDQILSNIIWGKYNENMLDWRKLNGNINKDSGPFANKSPDWFSIEFRTPKTSSGIKFSCDNRKLTSKQYENIIHKILGTFSTYNDISYKGFNRFLDTLQKSGESRVLMLDRRDCEVVIAEHSQPIKEKDMDIITESISHAVSGNGVHDYKMLCDVVNKINVFVKVIFSMFFMMFMAVLFMTNFPEFFQGISEGKLYLNF